MSLDTLNNGDSGLDARTKINAAIAAVNAGGGSSLIRASGVLQGNTTPGAMATPASGSFDLNGYSGGYGTISIGNGSETVVFTWGDADPEDGTLWLNSATVENTSQVIDIINTEMTGNHSTFNMDGMTTNRIALHDGYSAGGTSFLSISSTIGGAVASGTTYGTDATNDSGAITGIELIPADGSKAVIPLRVGLVTDGSLSGLNVEIILCVGGNYYPLALPLDTSSSAEVVIDLDHLAEWITPRPGSSLLANLNGSIPFGGTVTVWGIAEQY